MITSWNVNRFWKADKWKSKDFYTSSKDNTNKKMSDEFLKPIFTQIDKYLQNDDDVLILQEVPYKFFDNDKKKFEENPCLAHEKIKKYCYGKGYDILFPFKSPDSYSQTVAVFKKGQYDYDETYLEYVEGKFKKYRNKIIAVCKKGKKDLRVVGVHIPMNSAEFYDSLIALHRKMPEDIPIFYIGDYNTFDANTVNERKMFAFMSEGLVDLWLKSGKSHKEATFNADTRIDYALITEKDADKYEITADHDIRTKDKLSDHSAIILKERTPEMKKTGD